MNEIQKLKKPNKKSPRSHRLFRNRDHIEAAVRTAIAALSIVALSIVEIQIGSFATTQRISRSAA
ncbi:uncharacterized protein LY89DRAFT_682361, partial [Mollisia scopiformis]